MKQTLDQKLEALRDKLSGLPLATLRIHGNVLAMRKLSAETAVEIILVACESGAPGDDSSMESAAYGISETHSPKASARAGALSILEGSAEFKNADVVIAPLLLEIAATEAEIEAACVAHGEAVAKAKADHADALENARLAAESNPAVIAARKKLEALS